MKTCDAEARTKRDVRTNQTRTKPHTFEKTHTHTLACTHSVIFAHTCGHDVYNCVRMHSKNNNNHRRPLFSFCAYAPSSKITGEPALNSPLWAPCQRRVGWNSGDVTDGNNASFAFRPSARSAQRTHEQNLLRQRRRRILHNFGTVGVLESQDIGSAPNLLHRFIVSL